MKSPAKAAVEAQQQASRTAFGVYRAGAFLARSALRPLRVDDRRHPEIPTHATTPLLAAAVVADEIVMSWFPRLDPPDLSSEEIDAALAVWRENGWSENPAAFHGEPLAPMTHGSRPRSLRGLRYEELRFQSGFRAVPGLPGTDRWEAVADDEVRAYVLRHPGAPRPWVVNLHGHLAGEPMDLMTMRAVHVHRDLGFNVLHPVLAFHGPRRLRQRSGDGLLALDHLHNINAFGQLVWDVRRCIAWAREQGDPRLALHGLSLGGFTAAMVAALEDDVACVIAGVPFVAAAWAVNRRLPAEHRGALAGDRLAELYRVLDATALRCRVAPSGRFIYAGVADRITPPRQALALWRHWGRPGICWYGGAHVSAFSSRAVRRFVDAALLNALSGDRPPS